MPKRPVRSKLQVLKYSKRRGLYFDKRIGLDTFVGIAGIAITLGIPILVWGRAMESRVLNLEVTRMERNRTDVNDREDAKEQRTTMLQRLDKLDDKVTQMQIQIGRIVPYARNEKPR